MPRMIPSLKNLTTRWPHLATAAMCALSMVSPAHAGSTRPLYVFAPTSGDARLASQRSIISAASSGLAERDMPVIMIIADQVSGSPQSGAALRARFGIAPTQFRVILVGKDGGVKMSAASPVSAQSLFALVDAMPMRRQEMRAR